MRLLWNEDILPTFPYDQMEHFCFGLWPWYYSSQCHKMQYRILINLEKKKHKKHLIVGCDKAFCPTLPTLSGLMRSLLVVVWFCVWWFSLFSFFLVWFDLVWCSFVCVFCFYCIPSCQLTCKNNQFSCFKMCGVGANTICRIYSFRDCTNEVKQNDLFLVQRMN